MPAQVDSRVRRTRKTIQEALINLTVEKGYNTIRVQDIVDRAGINRSTFYRHYLDKDDLLSKYMDEVTSLTFQDDEPGQRTPSGIIKLLDHIRDFSTFYCMMLGVNGHPLVSDRLRRKIEGHFRMVLTKDSTRPIDKFSLEMRVRYASAASIGAILWWVENGTPASSEELAQWTSELSSAIL